MSITVSHEELAKTFSDDTQLLLVIKDKHFISANKAVLDLLGISSFDIFKTLHPAMISPEFQEDGVSSMLKAEELMAYAMEHGSNRFRWQHIKLDTSVFDVEVTLRKRVEGGNIYIDGHWRPLP